MPHTTPLLRLASLDSIATITQDVAMGNTTVKTVVGLKNSVAFFAPVSRLAGAFLIQSARASDIPTIDCRGYLLDQMSDAPTIGYAQMLSDEYLYYDLEPECAWIGSTFGPLTVTLRQLVTWEARNRARLADPAKKAQRECRRALRVLLGKAALN